MAICAVSRSRVSPTRMMSGSWRRKLRRAVANPRPISSFTWSWFTPFRLYSTGSSAVMMFTSGALIVWMAEYSVVVLPEPVGPVMRIIP